MLTRAHTAKSKINKIPVHVFNFKRVFFYFLLSKRGVASNDSLVLKLKLPSND